MHDLLFENQRHLKLSQLYDYARTLDLDMARVTAEMDDEIYLQRVREHQRSGESSGVRTTPGFFVNGRIQDVSGGMHSLFEAVESALGARARFKPGSRTNGSRSESRPIAPLDRGIGDAASPKSHRALLLN